MALLRLQRFTMIFHFISDPVNHTYDCTAQYIIEQITQLKCSDSEEQLQTLDRE